MKILYAGDSDIGGNANYLIGILNSIQADFVHVAPKKQLSRRYLKDRFDVIVLSDFPEAHVPDDAQELIERQVQEGAGFLMVGGWGSFSGASGGWHNTTIERLMPVSCLGKDDRVNFVGGALVVPKTEHTCIRALNFAHPPAIAGLNRVHPKKESIVVLCAKEMRAKRDAATRTYSLGFEREEHPLLVCGSNAHRRVAALATDLAPHWCGGLLDWGDARLSLPVTRKILIETGDLYVKFVATLLTWLARVPAAQRSVVVSPVGAHLV